MYVCVFFFFSLTWSGCDCCGVVLTLFSRVQEVEELRQKLQDVEIGTALSQADSNFLQRELEDKEADIGN